jgi:hypothetical protein
MTSTCTGGCAAAHASQSPCSCSPPPGSRDWESTASFCSSRGKPCRPRESRPRVPDSGSC